MTSKEYILPENIKSFLSKYYDGLTSLEEERLLKKYFADNQIPESNLLDKTLLSFGIIDEISVFPTNEIWKKIKNQEIKESKLRKNIKILSSVAASVIVIFSLSVGYYYTTKQDKLLTDSYSNPEDAYKAVQKYLGLVSTKLSYTYTELKPIEKLSIPCEAIQSFSTIDKGFQHLKYMDRINRTTREFERFSTISDIIINNKN